MKRKIVLCPDSFKGSLSASEVCHAMAAGLSDCDVVKVPIADGGEGTLDALAKSVVTLDVTGPDGDKVSARYGIRDGVAVIEMAEAAGITKTNKKSALTATSYGVGELIKDALDKGITDIMLTVGGSATNDGGCGMMAALGVKFFGKNGVFVPTGGTLCDIEKIDVSDVDKRLYGIKITALTDVTNPMVGKTGATLVYGRQKGADDDALLYMERGMVHLGDMLEALCKREVKAVAGAGAGGGLLAFFIAFFNIKMKSGIDAVLDMLDFDSIIRDADILVTGEGKIDIQSLYGKAISGVCRRAGKIPVYCVVGTVGDDRETLRSMGIADIFALTDICDDPDYCIQNASELITKIIDKIPRA